MLCKMDYELLIRYDNLCILQVAFERGRRSWSESSAIEMLIDQGLGHNAQLKKPKCYQLTKKQLK